MPSLWNDELQDNVKVAAWGRGETGVSAAHAISAIMTLPCLRAFWPCSFNYTSAVLGVAGYLSEVNGLGLLTNVNNTEFLREGLIGAVRFDGATQLFGRLDAGATDWADITGGELYIASTIRGLTLGGWFRIDRLTNREGLMSKWDDNVAASQQYHLSFRGDRANDQVQFRCRDAAGPAEAAHIFTPVVGTWYFLWGRFTASSGDLDAGVDDEYTTNAGAMTGILIESGTPFTVGAQYNAGVPAYYFLGRASLLWMCARSLPLYAIRSVYEQTRSLFKAP